MIVDEKMYTTLFNGISDALEKLENAEKEIAESIALLKESQIATEEMYICKKELDNEKVI